MEGPMDDKNPSPGTLGTIRRSLYALAGLVFLGIGAVGVVVPGLPTTVFLIIASWLFARSCPGLHRALLEHPRFGPPLRQFAEDRSMPRRAKISAVVAIWSGIGLSAFLAGSEALVLRAALLVLGLVGTGVIVLYVRTAEAVRTTAR